MSMPPTSKELKIIKARSALHEIRNCPEVDIALVLRTQRMLAEARKKLQEQEQQA